MSSLKLTPEFASSYLKETIPEYEEILVFIEKNGGWISLPPKIAELIIKLNIRDYPLLYRGKDTISKAFLLSYMPAAEINQLSADLEAMSDSVRTQYVEGMITSMCEDVDEALDNFPDTPEKELAAQKSFSELSVEDQAKSVKQAQLMFASFLAMFYNTFSIMVHGRKLTDLVLSAEGGDDESFCMAVQIDKRILSSLPYFRERYESAISEGNVDFLNKLNYRLTSPLLRGKIRYRTLWLTFALMEEFGQLDGTLKHREILDICEVAGVGGYINRIEDVGSLSKRLREYHQFQKINQRSRH